MTEFRPWTATHFVSAVVIGSPVLPVPFAEPGTTMTLTRVRAEWHRSGMDPWRLDVVTVRGTTSTGDGITVDYFPSNPSKRPPRELSEWIDSTHPRHACEEQRA